MDKSVEKVKVKRIIVLSNFQDRFFHLSDQKVKFIFQNLKKIRLCGTQKGSQAATATAHLLEAAQWERLVLATQLRGLLVPGLRLRRGLLVSTTTLRNRLSRLRRHFPKTAPEPLMTGR